MIGIMQPYFFPYIGYFQLIDSVDTYVNLDHVSFMKRSYMVRNVLKTDIKVNIPVLNGSQNKSCTEVMVLFDGKWFTKLLKTIEFNYSKSKNYSEIVNRFILPLENYNGLSISEFNLNIIKEVCGYLDIKTEIIDSSVGLTELKKGDGLIDISKKLNHNSYVNSIGGQKLYQKEYFKSKDIQLNFIEMGDVQFKNKYASILDLLFEYDRDYIKNELKKYRLL